MITHVAIRPWNSNRCSPPICSTISVGGFLITLEVLLPIPTVWWDVEVVGTSLKSSPARRISTGRVGGGRSWTSRVCQVESRWGSWDTRSEESSDRRVLDVSR